MLDMTTVALQLPLHTPTVSAWFYSTSHSALPAPRTHPPRRQRVQSDGSDPSIPSPSPSSSRSAAQRTQARDVSAIAHTRRRRRDGTRHPARDPASSSCENDPPATAANALACGRLSRDIKGQGSPKKEVQRQSHMLARRTYTWSCVRYSLVRNSPRGRGNSDRDGAAAEGVVACAAAVSARVQRINSSAASLLETRGLQVRGSGRGRIPIEDDGVVDEGEDEAPPPPSADPISFDPNVVAHEQRHLHCVHGHVLVLPNARRQRRERIRGRLRRTRGKNQPWSSNRDHKVHCGYFLEAELQFGRWVLDISDAWLAQASSIIQVPNERRQSTSTSLKLMWEMVLAAEDTATTPESIALLDGLPNWIHVFVQLPKITEGHIREPQIYWSTDGNEVENRSVPCSALKIWISWRTRFQTVHWEDHHYEVAEATQKRLGFDPTTNDAAISLDLPLLEVSNAEAAEQHDPEPDLGCRTLDPHTLRIIDDDYIRGSVE
ncbi:hypothetical protein C8R47DRAFT_1072184 [Mycena vitilis]|nr:hypothetical protein C8R47DRAFT_1072184 [Mycena vitilis]